MKAARSISLRVSEREFVPQTCSEHCSPGDSLCGDLERLWAARTDEALPGRGSRLMYSLTFLQLGKKYLFSIKIINQLDQKQYGRDHECSPTPWVFSLSWAHHYFWAPFQGLLLVRPCLWLLGVKIWRWSRHNMERTHIPKRPQQNRSHLLHQAHWALDSDLNEQ